MPNIDIDISHLDDKHQLALIRSAGKRNLFYFARFVLGYDKLVPRIHRPVCDMLQSILKERRTQDNVRLYIPRGTFKSTLASKALPLWILLNEPNAKILLISLTDNVATKLAREIRWHVEHNPLFEALYGDWRTGAPVWNENEFVLPQRTVGSSDPSLEARGVGSNLTGSHYDYIIDDDVVGRPDKESPAEREKKKERMDEYIPILNPDGARAGLGTFWHHDDYHVYELSKKNPDGTPKYVEGENLMVQPAINDRGLPWIPEVLSEDHLSMLRGSMAPAFFSAQYLLQPVAAETQVFRNIHYYEQHPPYNQLEISAWCDAAIGKSRESDLSAVVTIGHHKETGKIYVLKTTAEIIHHEELPEIALQRHAKPYPHEIMRVEDNGAMTLFVTNFRNHFRKNRNYTPIEGKPNTTKKEDRIESMAHLINDGTILFPRNMGSGDEELIRELENWPVAKYVDAVDALESSVRMVIGDDGEGPAKPAVYEPAKRRSRR